MHTPCQFYESLADKGIGLVLQCDKCELSRIGVQGFMPSEGLRTKIVHLKKM